MARVCNNGLIRLAKLAGGVDSVVPFTRIAVGTGAVAEADAGTALTTEVGRITVTPTYEASYKTVWSGTITGFAAAYSLTEVAILASDECMFMRHLWGSVRGVSIGDSIQLTLKATAGR